MAYTTMTEAFSADYVDYILEKLKELLAIDSPSGFTKEAAEYLLREYEKMGYHPTQTVKGGVLVDLGGRNPEDGILLAAHIDTLGAMVHEIKGNGRLRITPVGGLHPENTETENVRVVTRFSGSYEGTFQLADASVHVNSSYTETSRKFDHMEVLLDEKVGSRADVQALGIANGDFVCFEPRTRITSSGYIKSRFLDDKLSAAILLGHAKYLADTGMEPEHRLYHYFTVYEEVGHGASHGIPAGVKEAISVDMGCVGEGLTCTEHQVSICAKDSRSPYNYDVVTGLVVAAKENGIDYAVDIYPHYGSDVDTSLSAGHDLRHGLIGAGVYASHGYERSHVDGVKNTLRLITAYCK